MKFLIVFLGLLAYTHGGLLGAGLVGPAGVVPFAFAPAAVDLIALAPAALAPIAAFDAIGAVAVAQCLAVRGISRWSRLGSWSWCLRTWSGRTRIWLWSRLRESFITLKPLL
ncbi:uncharacterized protein LOC143258148 [Tachypleus tridentatus]|uniref:uncharacterized protein LOC143258148 n=1 Tax=Tachypleus tridentatus TaxID=6853 RepID=UPI003FCF7E1A